MTSWRESAASGQWQEIDGRILSADERAELIGMLREKLPLVERGDGLKTYSGSQRAWDTTTDELWYAAQLLRRMELLEWQAERDARRLLDPVSEAVDEAKKALRGFGIEFEGWRSTFMYRDPEKGSWNQLAHELGKKIQAVSDQVEDTASNLSGKEAESLRQWWQAQVEADPMLGSVNLDRLHALEFEEDFTPLWWAFEILRLMDRLDHWRNENDVQLMIESAFGIGRAFEALQNKPVEAEAQKAEKVAGGRRNSAHETNKRHLPQRLERLNRILEIRKADPSLSLSQVFLQCEAEGLGDRGAIKKQYYRRKKAHGH